MKIHNQYLEGGRFGVPEYTIPDQKEICSINMNTPPQNWLEQYVSKNV